MIAFHKGFLGKVFIVNMLNRGHFGTVDNFAWNSH